MAVQAGALDKQILLEQGLQGRGLTALRVALLLAVAVAVLALLA
jgi:hypothetical protein